MKNGIALDLGASALKRVMGAGALVRAIPDLARGGRRTPSALVASEKPLALAAQALADASRAFGGEPASGVAFVVSPGVSLEPYVLPPKEADGSGLERVEVVPAPVAIALAADVPQEDGASWVVLDLGHAALRAHLVTWHRVGEQMFPRLGASLVADASLAGLALDEALAKAAWIPVPAGAVATGPEGLKAEPPLPSPQELSARGFYELKELAAKVRGPLSRRVTLASGPVDLEVPLADVKAAFRAFISSLQKSTTALSKVIGESKPARIVAAGGLLELGPVRQELERALGERLLVLPDPTFAAARGALRALERPIAPRTPAPLSIVARRGTSVASLEVVPAGASLPGKFGPIALEVAQSHDPLEVLFLEGERALVATFPRRPSKSAVPVEVTWTWEKGFQVEVKDVGKAPLAALAPERARALREALAFKFDDHAETSPLDLVFVFVATQGEGPLLGTSIEALLTLAKGAFEKGRDVRAGAIATGDHPQGAVRPKYATLVHPPGDLASLETFVRAQQKEPVNGIDAPEALECALARASEVAWRADAERAVFVLTDVPPHEKGEPPFCNVDWREGVKKLRSLGVTLVPVFLEGGALAPPIIARTRAFLDALRGEGEPVHSVRGRASDALVLAATSLASRRRLDAQAREVIGRIALAAR